MSFHSNLLGSAMIRTVLDQWLQYCLVRQWGCVERSGLSSVHMMHFQGDCHFVSPLCKVLCGFSEWRTASRFQWKARKNIPSSRFWVCPGLLSYAHGEKSRRPLHQNRSNPVDFSQSDSACSCLRLKLFFESQTTLLLYSGIYLHVGPRQTTAFSGSVPWVFNTSYLGHDLS